MECCDISDRIRSLCSLTDILKNPVNSHNIQWTFVSSLLVQSVKYFEDKDRGHEFLVLF
jgi:hypothetical protein